LLTTTGSRGRGWRRSHPATRVRCTRLRARRAIAANGLSPAPGDEEAEQKNEKRAEEHEPRRVAERILFSEDIQRRIVGNEPDRNHPQEEEAHPPLEDM